MMRMKRVLLVCLLALVLPTIANAQSGATVEQRVFLNVNFGLEGTSHTVNDSGAVPLYDQTAVFSGERTIGRGLLFDLSGGYRVWQQLSVGIGYSRFSTTSDVDYTASVPHPLFFDRPRIVTVPITGLKHTEDQIHILFAWEFPVMENFDISIVAGPSIFKVRQDVPTTFSANEVGSPFSAVTITPSTSVQSKSAVGFNIGADGRYMFTNRFGAGVFLRYVHGSVNLQAPGTDVVSQSRSSLQFGAGLRMRF